MSLIAAAQRPLATLYALSGGVLMAVPTLRALGERFTFEQVVVACSPSIEHVGILRSIGFTQIHPLLAPVAAPATGDQPCTQTFHIEPLLSLGRDCDLLINLTLNEFGGDSFSALARQIGIPSIGFHAEADHVIGTRVHMHEMDRFFEAHRVFDRRAHLSGFARFPHRPDAGPLWTRLREAIGPRRLVALHADTKGNKMWPIEHWADWLQRLWEAEPDTQVALLGHPASAAASAFATDDRLHDCRDLPLTANFEVVAMADVFVGVDSCMLHAADLCRVPVVGIFTHRYPPAGYGARFADSGSLEGANPPCDVAPHALWKAYCRLRDRQLGGFHHTASSAPCTA
jgi:hypothetical protein